MNGVTSDQSRARQRAVLLRTSPTRLPLPHGRDSDRTPFFACMAAASETIAAPASVAAQWLWIAHIVGEMLDGTLVAEMEIVGFGSSGRRPQFT